jgi:phenylacetyl-CoA:acceptor oxidoreductase subunit 2
MSREAWFAAILFPAGASVLLGTPAWMSIASLLPAAGFLFSQAMILQQAKGIPAWRSNWLVPVMVLTGLVEGVAMFSFFHAIVPLVLALVVLRAAAWHGYYESIRRSGAPTHALAVLRDVRPWMLWGGTVTPIVLLIAGAAPLGCLAALMAGWAFKFVIVTKAGYQQGFALERAGVMLKPGWTTAERTT